MWLLDKFLQKAIKRGKLVVTDYDGKVYEYGPSTEGMQEFGGGQPKPIRITLTNRKAANHIARYPQVGAGEAYMWGWLVVEEPHDIRDMVLFVTWNAKDMGDSSLKAKGPVRKLAQRILAKADSINLRGKARKNAASLPTARPPTSAHASLVELRANLQKCEPCCPASRAARTTSISEVPRARKRAVSQLSRRGSTRAPADEPSAPRRLLQ